MLKNIPEVISPDLMMAMMKMGHGDEICFVDANFPADSNAQRIIRADGHTITELIDAMLRFYPLDEFVDDPAVIMEAPKGSEPAVWKEYEEIVKKNDFANAFKKLTMMDKPSFFERTRKCYAVVATNEREGYSNIILRKGVIFK